MDNSMIPHALPMGFELLSYKIKTILGKGGFGITYLAKDRNLNRYVAIKEFMPIEFVTRNQKDCSVKLVTKNSLGIFQWGLDRFRSEAQILARFRHRNIVQVLSLFDENNTAYMVMEYEQGVPFGELIKKNVNFSEAMLIQMVLPVLDGLKRIHDQGFVHRDIKPSNIYIRKDRSPVLLDFGSARQSSKQETGSLTSLVTYGYAPFEQYNLNGQASRQGPWTDIYSLAATLYHAITGKVPQDAMSRASAILCGKTDPYLSLERHSGRYPKYSLHFLSAIDSALSFKEKHRPQSVEAWSHMLSGKTPLVNNKKVGLAPANSMIRSKENTLSVKSASDALTTMAALVFNSGLLRHPAFIIGITGISVFLTLSKLKPSPLNLQTDKDTRISASGETVSPSSVAEKHNALGVVNRIERLPGTMESEKIRLQKVAEKIEILESQIEEIENTELPASMKSFKRYQVYREILKLDPFHLASLAGIEAFYLNITEKILNAVAENNLVAARKKLDLLIHFGGPEKAVEMLKKEIKIKETAVAKK